MGRTMSRPRRMTIQSQPKANTHTPQRRMPHLRGGRIRIGRRFKIWSTWLWLCNEKCAIPLLVLAISLSNTLHLNETPSSPTLIKPIWLLQLYFSFPSDNCHFRLGSYGARSYCHNWHGSWGVLIMTSFAIVWTSRLETPLERILNIGNSNYPFAINDLRS